MGDKKDCGRANFRYLLITGMITTIFMVASLFAVYSVPVVNANAEGDGDSGSIIYVPDEYPTIQQAIDAANDGDTIIIENGTYDEQIIINKNLTIQGQGATIIKPSQSTANGFFLFSRKAGGSANTAAIVVVNADATIKNLKIDGSNITSVPGGATLVGILYRGVNGTIDSVTVDNISVSSGIGGNAIYISSMGNEVNVEVKGCTISNFYKNGITANYEGLTVNIHDNIVIGSGPIDNAAQNGIQIGLNAEGIVKNNVIRGEYYTGFDWTATGILIYAASATVEDNTIINSQTGIDATGDYWGRFSNPWTVSIINNTVDASNLDASQWATGIAVATYSDGEIINADIENNQIIGGDASDTGIAIGIAYYGCPGNVIFAIKNNNISNLDYGIYLEGSMGSGSTIVHNTIQYSDCGVYICDGANATNVTIHYNNITGNTDWSIYNNGTDILDATCNWWGDATGPYHAILNVDGQGDNVSDNVEFTPWMDAPYPEGQPYADIFIDLNGNELYDEGEPAFYSIQSAIDDAREGDTIVVGPGIYKESLIINKSLKIVGDPVIDAHGSKYGVQIQANYTLIENFTVYNYTEIGIYIHNESFTLQNVTVNNCRIFNSTYNTGKHGIKLEKTRNVSIFNCQIHNNSEIGIYIINSENSKLENNTISNSEYGFKLSSSKYNSLLNNTLVKNEQGICLLKSSSRNKLANNNISTRYYGIYVKSSYNQILNNTLLCNGGEGIYLESAKNNLVENNTISGGYYGMHLYKSDNNVLSNNTVSNTLLYTDKAIYLESANSNLIDNNTISGGHQGIYLYKSDENTLYNNTIKSNRYCGILVSHSNENVIDNNTIIDGVDGIYLDNSEKNSITNNSISNIQNGIWLSSSNENRISDNLLSGITWDIYVLDSEENLISNNTFSASYPTTASLRYKGNFAIRGINNPPENPDGFDDIGSFLNISSLSDESTWINLSIRYNENNVIINEDYLLIWMYNETGWHKEGWNETRYLDTTKNIIGVNITNPEGIFAPLQDIQPPVSTKTIGDPNCTIGGEDWITRDTPVWLDAEDNINGTGVDAIYYRVWYNESWHPADSQDSYGGNHNITMYNEIYWYVYSNDTVKFGPIYFMEEGKHYIEFFSTDRAGNEETPTNQTIYVDDTPPHVIIEMGIPHHIQDESIFINSSTSIWINVTDMMNLYIINWTIWNETGVVYSSGISEKNLTLYIAEEGKYTIGYWAEDGLGNRWPASGYDNTTVYVDNTPPEVNMEIGEPNTEDPLFVTARTPFNLSSDDGGKYPVGTGKICYRVWNIYTGWSDWKIYFANITLDEEGLHYIEYYAEDHLGNRGDIHNITCYVDDVPPITTGEGYYPIYLRTIDPGWDECPGVGVYCIHYRYKIGDGDWSDWFVNETDENLTLWIPSPSVSPGGEPIHLEYYSEDLLGNREDINYGVFTREINHPPLKPSNPSPANNSEDIPINPVLSVYVSDPDNDPLDVYFYNADNNDLIGSVKNVPSDSTVTIEWKNLERNRTYSWYVVVNDSEYSTKSDTWYFKTTSKNLAPYVKLIKPADAVYLLDKEIMPFLLPIIFGKITIEVNATDSDGTIEKVEFYVDDVLRSTDTAEPYTWTWDERIIGLHKITVIAYDDCGETAKTSRSLLIFNLKIL